VEIGKVNIVVFMKMMRNQKRLKTYLTKLVKNGKLILKDKKELLI